jgi:membrane protein implicated in regulation of membrane protease activity
MEISLDPWHLWLIAAVLLITAEIFAPGFVLVGLGFAAVFAALAHFVSDDLGWALGAYSAAALIFFVAIRPLAVRTFMDNKPSPFGINAMVGQQVTVADSPDVGGGMQTQFKDTTWSVESEDDLMEGDRAEIIAVKSTTLVVKRLAN